VSNNVIVPFFEGRIGRFVYCKDDELSETIENVDSSLDKTYFLKSLYIQEPHKGIEQKVWITLPSKKGNCNQQLENFIATNTIQSAIVESVADSLKINLKKAISRANGTWLLDTSDALPYVETAAFRFLEEFILGMTDGETRNVDLPFKFSRNGVDSNISLSLSKLMNNAFNFVITEKDGQEIHSGGPYILPHIAAELIHFTGWYTSPLLEQEGQHILKESPVIAHCDPLIISNNELVEGLDQILTEARAEVAVSAISSIEMELQTPTPNMDEIYKMLKLLQADVLGLQSKTRRIAELTDQEIDAIQQSISVLRNHKNITINVGS
jgi:hypothetical protein